MASFHRKIPMFLSLFILFSVLSTVHSRAPGYIVSPVILNATNYQRWAHYHWVWVHNSKTNQEAVEDLVNGYEEHLIPVGVVNIDSTWATQFDNFEVNTKKFPNFPGMIESFHSKGIHVTLWSTSMVNVENPDFDMCVEKQYLLRDSKGYVRPLQWWHGSGGLLDYSNPEAVKWWHSKMDLVLDVGVDGFKVDGTDPYIIEYSLTGGALGYQDNVVTYPEYAHMYYRDFLYYTREKRSEGTTRGDAGLIMSRPVDCQLDKISKLCIPFSPKDVMFSGWVGDDDSTFNGMRGCLRKLIYSAWMGYGNYACDTGGYRGSDSNTNVEDSVLLLRWAQLSSFLPLFENGGGGEHRPWMFQDVNRTVSIYRKFVLEHYRLLPYLHTIGSIAVRTNTSTIHPVDDRNLLSRILDGDFLNQQTAKEMEEKNDGEGAYGLPFPQPFTYSYMLGDSILVHPVVNDISDKSGLSVVNMAFPIPSTDKEDEYWLDYFHPTRKDRAIYIPAKSNVTFIKRDVALEDLPVYVRRNAFFPRDVSVSQFTDVEEHPMILFTWFGPRNNISDAVRSECEQSIVDGSGLVATAQFTSKSTLVASLSAAMDVNISVSSPKKNFYSSGGFQFVGVSEPDKKDIFIEAFSFFEDKGDKGTYPFDAMHSSSSNGCYHTYDAPTEVLTVACKNLRGGMRVSIDGIEPTVV